MEREGRDLKDSAEPDSLQQLEVEGEGNSMSCLDDLALQRFSSSGPQPPPPLSDMHQTFPTLCACVEVLQCLP